MFSYKAWFVEEDWVKISQSGSQWGDNFAPFDHLAEQSLPELGFLKENIDTLEKLDIDDCDGKYTVQSLSNRADLIVIKKKKDVSPLWNCGNIDDWTMASHAGINGSLYGRVPAVFSHLLTSH